MTRHDIRVLRMGINCRHRIMGMKCITGMVLGVLVHTMEILEVLMTIVDGEEVDIDLLDIIIMGIQMDMVDIKLDS